jgi:hypothetical protein
MKKNVGSADKIIRIVLGLAIIIICVAMRNWWGIIGVLPLVTAFISWCPAYLPFGISTCKTTVK